MVSEGILKTEIGILATLIVIMIFYPLAGVHTYIAPSVVRADDECVVYEQTDANVESLGIARRSAALAVLYTLCEALSNDEYCQKADELDNTLDAALSDFRAGTICAEEFVLITSSEINKVQDFLEVKEKEAEEATEEEAKKECFIVNPGYPLTSDNPCIITNNQAMAGAVTIGLGIAGIFILMMIVTIRMMTSQTGK